MHYRKLCKNGPEISAISYGAWGISGKDWGDTDDSESIEAINTALDNGVNLIDTADVYGFGHSDELINNVLKDRNEKGKVFVATKAGNDFYNQKDEEGNPDIVPNYNKDYLLGAVDKSLERLEVEQLDLLQLHSPTTEMLQSPDPWDALAKLKSDKKIKYAGISIQSFKETEQAGFLDEYYDIIDVLQVRYNMLEREAEKELFPKAQKYGIGIIVRIPLLFGFLTGKFTKDSKFGENDHRRFNLSHEKLEDYFERLEKLKPFFEKHNEYSMAQLSLGFTLKHPAVSCAIPGGKNPKQVKENCEAANIDLSIYDELF